MGFFLALAYYASSHNETSIFLISVFLSLHSREFRLFRVFSFPMPFKIRSIGRGIATEVTFKGLFPRMCAHMSFIELFPLSLLPTYTTSIERSLLIGGGWALGALVIGCHWYPLGLENWKARYQCGVPNIKCNFWIVDRVAKELKLASKTLPF